MIIYFVPGNLCTNAARIWFIINILIVFIDKVYRPALPVSAFVRFTLINDSLMQEINPIKNQIADLKDRGNALRGYL